MGRSVRSMDDLCYASNRITDDTKNLLEEQVPHDPAALNMREETLSHKSQSIHVHTKGDPSAVYLHDIQDVSGTSNKDESKSIVPNTCDSFEKHTEQNNEHVTEELVPFTFVAVSEINEPNEGHQDYRMCFDSALKDPLGEYSGTVLDITEQRIAEKESSFQNELLVKKEPEDEKDVPQSMIEDVFLIPDELTHSFHELISTKCNAIKLCDQESGLDRNSDVKLSGTLCSEICFSEKTCDMEIQYESICEISGGDVKEKKVFETGQCLNHFVGDNTGTSLLDSKSELLDSIKHFSRIDYKQDVNEEDCESTSKISTRFSLESGKKFPAIYEQPASTSSKTGDRPFECEMCKKSFSQKRNLRIHMGRHTKNRSFLCGICKKSFHLKGEFKRHILRHTGERRFACDVCKKSFFLKEEFKRHILSHTGERPFACDICKKSFSLKGVLKRHKRMHTGERPFLCDICGKSFTERGTLNKHNRLHTAERAYDCKMCEKSFSKWGHLKQHMGTHKEEKLFECDVCKKHFCLKRDINRHMRTHTGDRPFVCDICAKSFSQRAHLKTHMRTHTGDRPFVCVICHKSFSWKGDLTVHNRMHREDRPFECEICKKSFSRRGHLKEHMKKHTGEKLFECVICKNSFSRKGVLKRHMRTHTGDRPFVCDICEKSFSRKEDLNKHRSMHSGD